MSDTDNIEQRLRAFAAAPDDGADWEDVVRRSGKRLSPQRLPRRRRAFTLAAAVVVAAALAGVLVTRGTQPVRTGAGGPGGLTGANGPTGFEGPTGAGGPIGSEGPTGTGGVPGVTGVGGPIGSVGPTGLPPRQWPGPTGTQGPTGHFGPTGAVGPIRPVFLTAAGLAAESRALARPVYWAGPRDTSRYEFVRTSFGDVYVRYLPGDTTRELPIVATYHVHGAFDVLKKQAGGTEIAGPRGSVILEGWPATSVYVAFPGVDYEIEIYDPAPAVARAIAESGAIHPVG
jgi:hypothetical protein